jgi:hypothetical protein
MKSAELAAAYLAAQGIAVPATGVTATELSVFAQAIEHHTDMTQAAVLDAFGNPALFTEQALAHIGSVTGQEGTTNSKPEKEGVKTEVATDVITPNPETDVITPNPAVGGSEPTSSEMLPESNKQEGPAVLVKPYDPDAVQTPVEITVKNME